MKKWLLQMTYRKVILLFFVTGSLCVASLVVEFIFLPGYFPLLSLVVMLALTIKWGFVLYWGIFYQFRQVQRELRQSYHSQEIRLGLERQLQPRARLPVTRHWAASPDFLLLIVRHIKTQQPETVLELGSGVSTLYTAYCLEQHGKGKLYSIEHDADFAAETRERVREHGLETWVEVIHAPLVKQDVEGRTVQWYQRDFIKRLPTVDVLVVDGPPWKLQRDSRYPALPLLHAQLSEQATILVDDYLRTDEKRMVRRWKQAYPEFHLTEHLHFDKEAAVLSR